MLTSENTGRDSLLAAVLSDEGFFPAEPRTLEETGLTVSLVESLIAKHLATVGTASGRAIAEAVCLPFGVLESLFQSSAHTADPGSHRLGAAERLLLHAHRARARTGRGVSRGVRLHRSGAGAAVGLRAVGRGAVDPRRSPQAARGWKRPLPDISIDPNLFDSLGPAVNSGAGLFLYGAPGNGKSTLARRITICFGQQIWLPQTLIEDGQIIKLFDAVYHEVVENRQSSLIKAAAYDRRWVKIRRPTVVVGGELTMDGLEIRHDPVSNTSEAPLQLKSNCGCLLIDDFGRQRIEPAELLNRWIIPLENRQDYLTLSTGKKIRVPFEQLIIFSTNLEPQDLVDEAFLAAHSLQNPDQRPGRGRVPPPVRAVCRGIRLRIPRGRRRSPAANALSRPQPADASLPSARPARPGSQLLRLQRPADGDAARVFRPRREELFHRPGHGAIGDCGLQGAGLPPSGDSPQSTNYGAAAETGTTR